MKSCLILMLMSFNLLAQETPNSELLDFSSIKEIIKKDGLQEELSKKGNSQKKQDTKKANSDKKKFNVPKEDEFWNMFSELWLVKNATKLKWDFQKPDFDLESSFKELLESQGHFEKKFKILLIDSTELVHAALPSNENEFIFVLSYPFIKSLDLSKVEISLVLFEDFLRARRGYFKNFVKSKELDLYFGSNFQGKKFDKALINKHLLKYNQKLFEKGFSFQEQFDVTMEMNSLLKPNATMWNTYYRLLEKIEIMTKDNVLYKKHNQIYPSAELQKNWLRPKETRL